MAELKNQIIKKLTEREHILARSGMYLGSSTITKSKEYVIENNKFFQKEIEYVPGLVKIFNELIDNGIDEYVRTQGQFATKIDVTIDSESFSVTDSGRGIPVTEVETTEGLLYQPELAWTHARAGSNFEDENSSTIGTNGVGSMIAPLYAGQMLVMGFSWRRVYQFGAGIALLVLIYFLLAKYPRTTSVQSNKLDFKNLGKSVFSGQMILFFASITAYVAAEIGIGAWLVEFLQKVKLQSISQSTFYLALFFGTITIGRLVGSFFVSRIGYLKSLFYAGLAAAICVSIGIFGSMELTILLPLSGFFYSIIFSTITAAVSDLHQENQGAILGLLFTFAGIGGMLGPWVVGLTSDWFGMQLGFGLVLVFLILMNIFFALLLKKEKKNVY